MYNYYFLPRNTNSTIFQNKTIQILIGKTRTKEIYITLHSTNDFVTTFVKHDHNIYKLNIPNNDET